MLGCSVFAVVTQVMLLELAVVTLVVLIAVFPEVTVCNQFIYLIVEVKQRPGAKHDTKRSFLVVK